MIVEDPWIFLAVQYWTGLRDEQGDTQPLSWTRPFLEYRI